MKKEGSAGAGKKSGKKEKKGKILLFIQKHKIALIITGIILFILFVVFGAKIALLFNFILGNDIVVKLESAAPFLELVHGEQQEINFKASVTTNPFCKAACTSTFDDISQGKTIEKDEFTLRPSLPLEKKYTLTPPSLGSGIQLYRFNIECQSVQTILCHTSEEPTTRNVLVTVQYDLTEQEKEMKNGLQQQLHSLVQRIGELQGQRNSFSEAVTELNKSIEVSSLSEDITVFSVSLNTLLQKLKTTAQIWHQQNFVQLSEAVGELNANTEEKEEESGNINKKITSHSIRYNSLLDNIKIIQKLLEELRNQKVTDAARALEINNAIHDANMVSEKTTLNDTEDTTETILPKVTALYNQTKRENIQRELDADINADVLCAIAGSCLSHKPIEELAAQETFSSAETCDAIKIIIKKINEVNESMKDAFGDENFPDDEDFWNNISAKVKNSKQEIIDDYRKSVPLNSQNENILLELLALKPILETENYPQYNLTPALIGELQKQQPEECQNIIFLYEELLPVSFTPIEISVSSLVPLEISFGDIPPQCCVFGKCQECCISETCQNDPATFPVVFVHGHAVSKDTSFEYSLEGFNQIQKKLEEDGYLNSGAITVYTTRDFPAGLWGEIGVPLTIRGSYYFDLFQQPENYVVVQTKSENIETYAIRLKEVIDTIKYKTGKPKVTIVAFSMGGLVSRKYIQLFGTDSVHKFIMIGTPNHGIQGDIAEYCPLTGEKLECRDMNADSLFMNKLNRGKLPDLPMYNIVGTGCDMDGKQGDGAVLEESARLDGAQNFIINGTCRGKAYPLHLELRNIEKYPKVYEIVKKALKE